MNQLSEVHVDPRTGTTSGLGKETARALLNTGEYYVIGACRDVEKMKAVAKKENFDEKSFSVLELDLGSFKSTRDFVTKLNNFKKGKPLDSLVCNAAVYQPSLSVVSDPRFPRKNWIKFHCAAKIY